MLRLVGPFALYMDRPGIHISITAPGYHAKQVARAAAQCGCPPPVRPKIALCIRHSGRYDCIVSSTAARTGLDDFIKTIRKLGGDVVVTPVADFQTETRVQWM